MPQVAVLVVAVAFAAVIQLACRPTTWLCCNCLSSSFVFGMLVCWMELNELHVVMSLGIRTGLSLSSQEPKNNNH